MERKRVPPKVVEVVRRGVQPPSPFPHEAREGRVFRALEDEVATEDARQIPERPRAHFREDHLVPLDQSAHPDELEAHLLQVGERRLQDALVDYITLFESYAAAMRDLGTSRSYVHRGISPLEFNPVYDRLSEHFDALYKRTEPFFKIVDQLRGEQTPAGWYQDKTRSFAGSRVYKGEAPARTQLFTLAQLQEYVYEVEQLQSEVEVARRDVERTNAPFKARIEAQERERVEIERREASQRAQRDEFFRIKRQQEGRINHLQAERYRLRNTIITLEEECIQRSQALQGSGQKFNLQLDQELESVAPGTVSPALRFRRELQATNDQWRIFLLSPELRWAKERKDDISVMRLDESKRSTEIRRLEQDVQRMEGVLFTMQGYKHSLETLGHRAGIDTREERTYLGPSYEGFVDVPSLSQRGASGSIDTIGRRSGRTGRAGRWEGRREEDEISQELVETMKQRLQSEAVDRFERSNDEADRLGMSITDYLEYRRKRNPLYVEAVERCNTRFAHLEQELVRDFEMRLGIDWEIARRAYAPYTAYAWYRPDLHGNIRAECQNLKEQLQSLAQIRGMRLEKIEERSQSAIDVQNARKDYLDRMGSPRFKKT